MTTPQSRYARRLGRRAGITRAWIAIGIVAGLTGFVTVGWLMAQFTNEWVGYLAVLTVAAVGVVFIGFGWRPWEKKP